MLRWGFGTGQARSGSLELDTIDVRSASERHEYDLVPATSRALERISVAGGGFGELVTSHLRVVAAMPSKTGVRVHPVVAAFVSPFAGHERTNAHLWASHLVWAATVSRLARNAMIAHGGFREPHIRAAAWAAQQRFLRQFEEPERWIDYLAPRFGVQ